MQNISQIEALREYVLYEDNDACFVERDCLLLDIRDDVLKQDEKKRHSYMIDKLLSRLSTPIHCDDVFLGRMVQGRMWGHPVCLPDECWLWSIGHMHPDYPTLLKKGLARILEEAWETHKRLKTEESRYFAENTEVSVLAIKKFAERYARNARLISSTLRDNKSPDDINKAADALEKVPFKPATTFFEALQSIAFMNMILHCVVGARDFGVGWMDRYLQPYYQADIEKGIIDKDEAVRLMANFLIKMNELGGTRSDKYPNKPIWSQATNQYLLLGGYIKEGVPASNEMTEIILDAAKLSNLPQPSLMVYIDPAMPRDFKMMIMKKARELSGQVQFYNANVIINELLKQKIAPEISYDAAHHACCLLSIPYRMGPRHTDMKELHMHRVLLMMLNDGVDATGVYEPLLNIPHVSEIKTYEQAEDLLISMIAPIMEQNERIAHELWDAKGGYMQPRTPYFNLESLLIRGCVEHGLDWVRGGIDILYHGCIANGISTTVDAMMAIKWAVFEEKLVTLEELRDICNNNFEGHEILRQRIKNSTEKFGNNLTAPDSLCRRICKEYLDAHDILMKSWPKSTISAPGYYHLWGHRTTVENLPATPDGRLYGEPINENQSPVYGADTHGLTAMLTSLENLQNERTLHGGLNVRFGTKIPAEKLLSVIDTYFSKGGLHLAANFINAQTLKDAKKHPEKYKSLQVRMYGYSALFNLLPDVEKQELIDRTEY